MQQEGLPQESGLFSFDYPLLSDIELVLT